MKKLFILLAILAALLFASFIPNTLAQTQAEQNDLCSKSDDYVLCGTCSNDPFCYPTWDGSGNQCAEKGEGISSCKDREESSESVTCKDDNDCANNQICANVQCTDFYCIDLCLPDETKQIDNFNTGTGFNLVGCTHSSDGTLTVTKINSEGNWKIQAGSTRGYFYTVLGCGGNCFDLNQWKYIQIKARAPTNTDFHLSIRYTDPLNCAQTINFGDQGIYLRANSGDPYINNVFNGFAGSSGNLVTFTIPISAFGYTVDQLQHAHSIHFDIPPNTAIKLDNIALINE